MSSEKFWENYKKLLKRRLKEKLMEKQNLKKIEEQEEQQRKIKMDALGGEYKVIENFNASDIPTGAVEKVSMPLLLDYPQIKFIKDSKPSIFNDYVEEIEKENLKNINQQLSKVQTEMVLIPKQVQGGGGIISLDENVILNPALLKFQEEFQVVKDSSGKPKVVVTVSQYVLFYEKYPKFESIKIFKTLKPISEVDKFEQMLQQALEKLRTLYEQDYQSTVYDDIYDNVYQEFIDTFLDEVLDFYKVSKEDFFEHPEEYEGIYEEIQNFVHETQMNKQQEEQGEEQKSKFNTLFVSFEFPIKQILEPIVEEKKE